MSLLLSLQLMLALLSLGMVSVDCLHRSSSKCHACDAWRKCHMAEFYLLFCTSSLSHFVLISTFLLPEIWGMNMPNLPEVFCLEDLLVLGCVHHACVTAIDAPLTMIVVVGWVLLWYSQCPHNAFVAFIGKAALWLQGWLPWHSLSH